jgi:hypothetical protein
MARVALEVPQFDVLDLPSIVMMSAHDGTTVTFPAVQGAVSYDIRFQGVLSKVTAHGTLCT